MELFSYTAKEGELWVSCCKHSIGIVPQRKIASTNGGFISNQNCLRSPKPVSQRYGCRRQTKQLVGSRWATILTIITISASSIRKAACTRGSDPKRTCWIRTTPPTAQHYRSTQPLCSTTTA